MGSLETTVRTEMDRRGLPQNEHLIGSAILAVGRRLGIENPFKFKGPLENRTDDIRKALSVFLDK